ncbi:MAG: hypothetical protein JSW40_00400 [Candidatus Omnitrophota bacterium]|nr:MAG: hypothetical protein JSW40_00400 [Candidatus Omnitrophota bacterium]
MKTRKIILLVFLGCFLFSLVVIVPLTLFVSFTINKRIQRMDNAAMYYNKAFKLCSEKHWDKKVEEVVGKGWRGEYKDLEGLLNRNKAMFMEFENGIQLKRCDFSFGKVYDNPFAQPFPNLLKVRNLSQLVLLKGRWHEAQNDYDEAMRNYLSLLTFTQHISQDRLLVSVMIATAVELMASVPLQQYLERDEVDMQLCKRIKDFLQRAEPQRSIIADAFKKEREAYMWAARVMSKKVGIRDRDLMRSFRGVGSKYYGLLVKYARTNSETDKRYLEEELDFLSRRCSTLCSALMEQYTSKDWPECIDKYLSSLKENLKTATREEKDKGAELLACGTVPSLIKAVNSYYDPKAKLRILKLAAAIRLYIFQEGRLPDTLDNLIPDYLEAIPLDPWSGQPLIYVRQGRQFTLYSFGPDRTDNNGTGVGFETVLESIKELEGKDIVFSATPSIPN